MLSNFDVGLDLEKVFMEIRQPHRAYGKLLNLLY